MWPPRRPWSCSRSVGGWKRERTRSDRGAGAGGDRRGAGRVRAGAAPGRVPGRPQPVHGHLAHVRRAAPGGALLRRTGVQRRQDGDPGRAQRPRGGAGAGPHLRPGADRGHRRDLPGAAPGDRPAARADGGAAGDRDDHGVDGLPRRAGARGGDRLVQLRGAEPGPGPRRARHAGHLLLPRVRGPAAAHAHLADADPGHGAAEGAAHLRHHPGPHLPPGRQRRVARGPVHAGRGAGRGRGDHGGRPEGHHPLLRPVDVGRRPPHPHPAHLLPLHGAQLRVRPLLRHLRRPGLPDLRRRRLAGGGGLRHGPPERAPQRRHRPRALLRVRVGLRHRAHRDAPLRHRGHPPLLRERHAIPGAAGMRVSYEWLCDLAGVHDVPAHQAAEVLTMAGWNVDEVIPVDLSALRVGRVLSQELHPRSRRPLWIHQVNLGDHTRQIVAGADNARPGSLVAVALPGTTVPSGTVVRDTEIAGVAARGMLSSEFELLVSDDHDGIMLLDEGRPGQPLEELIPSDAIFEVEVTPNRPDCLGHLGLARELAAALGRSLGRDFMPPFTGGVEPPGTDLVEVAIEAPDLCRRYIGAPISGVRVGRSPRWLRRRLFRAGVRPITNVVDVTNYVALEYGQPLHAFDLARIGGRRIVVRRARPGERLWCLDGETRSLTADMLVIADAERPVALAGIIGGEESAVTEATTDILLEAANFDGVSVRATSRALRLRTEASGRFEKGLSPEFALAGARRAAMLLAEIAGGRVHVGWADEYPRPQEPARVRFRPAQVDAVLGVHVPLREMESILRRLDFQVRVQDDGEWDLLPPVFRLDVSIPEDVAEEVGRMYGYDRVPPTLPGARRTHWRPLAPSLERRLDGVRHALAGAGLTEVVTPALTSGDLLEGLGLGEGVMRVINPVADDQDALRTSLLPSLLR